MDAEQYADIIKAILNNFRYLELRPQFPSSIQIPLSNPSYFHWKDTIHFRENRTLKIRDSAEFGKDGMTYRSFSYDFRDNNTNRLIWRICNHDDWQPVTNSCHIHCDPYDEEARNEFFQDSKRTDFPYVVQCIRKFYEGEAQDWEKGSDNESATQTANL